MTIVTGTFDTLQHTHHAIDRIARAGLGRAEVSMMMNKDVHSRLGTMDVTIAGDTSAAKAGLGIGGAIGGTVGALVAGLAAVGAIVVPGVGLLVAGPIVALLAGAGAGGATGGLVGALVGLGVPKTEAVDLEGGLSAGRIVVTVDVDTADSARAQAILRDEGGVAVGVGPVAVQPA